MAIETSVGDPTVSVVEPLTVPEVAVIVVTPCAMLVASPVLPTVAMLGLEEVQVTELVRFCVVLLLYVPVAVNCWFVLTGIVGFAGVTAIETRAGGVTVSVVVALIVPEAAFIVAVP